MKERTGPLSDVRILDLTQALAGPFCTMLLADLGADVIKVEPPHGDMARRLGPPFKDRTGCDYTPYFASVNRNKRSIVIDLKNDEGRATLLKLATTVDAVVENARSGVMDRGGVGYEVLRAQNPAIVYAAVRGFGDARTGASPYSDWPAFDVVAQCMGGLVSMTGPQDGGGYRVGPGIGDTYPGTLAALGVVSAIHAARRSGEGQFLDVSMYDAVLTLCESMIYNYSLNGLIVPPAGNSSRIIVPFDIFKTSDGAVSIAAPTDNHWAALCEAMERRELIKDDRTRSNPRRVANGAYVRGLIGEWTEARTTAAVVAALGGKVPVGPVNTAREIFADPHPRIREMLVEVQPPGDNPPLTIAGTPIKLTGTPAGVYARAPMLGEHTAEILAEAASWTHTREPGGSTE
jgi:crotonobetainyl-CoA:carnitine CoA-transferase CaiB-like acyl-CoA transferase